MKTAVLYHAHCADGFGAAWAVWKKIGDVADYLPCSYGAPVPDVSQYAMVVLVDFSYPRAQLDDWRASGVLPVIIDHHKTAQADLEGYPNATFDMEHSGAWLAWRHFHPEVPAPPLVAYVQDRDLWTWGLDQSREVSAALWSTPMTFDAWSDFAIRLEGSGEHGWHGVVREGAAILRYMDQQVDLITAQASLDYWTIPRVDGLAGKVTLPVAVCNATNLWSEIGEALLRKFPDATFAASYYDSRHGTRKWSLRSRGDFDVSAVAKRYGGGGHAAAAGFESALPQPMLQARA